MLALKHIYFEFRLLKKINLSKFEIHLEFYIPNWLPRRYCKYAATKSPVIVTGTRPKTIPDNNTSTILYILLIK